jgi:hypothetical protein
MKPRRTRQSTHGFANGRRESPWETGQMRTKSTYRSETQITLRGASQSDNRQVGMTGDMFNFHDKPGAGLPGD